MKKSILLLSLALAAVVFVAVDSYSAQTSVSAYVAGDDDEKKEKIVVDSLPAAVSKAWSAGPNAKAKITGANKVSKGTAVFYEILFADPAGAQKAVRYKADGSIAQ